MGWKITKPRIFFTSNIADCSAPNLIVHQSIAEITEAWLALKFEIRSTKHETNLKSEFLNVQNANTEKDLSPVSIIWILVIRICLRFRNSDFEFCLQMSLSSGPDARMKSFTSQNLCPALTLRLFVQQLGRQPLLPLHLFLIHGRTGSQSRRW